MEDWNRREVLWMMEEIAGHHQVGKLTLEEKEIVEKWIKKRKEGYPLQYLFRHWDFHGNDFLVDERALIPRPETELLVEKLLTRISPGDKILEIGVGTGAILFSVLKQMPTCIGVGVDISPQALELAGENARRLSLSPRLYLSDVYSNLQERNFQWIISNPPYIDQIGMMEIGRELSYEPRNALYGGKDGLDIYKKIIFDAKKFLSVRGNIAFEIGYNQREPIYKLLEESGFDHIELLKDFAGFDRMIFAKGKEEGLHVRESSDIRR